MDSLVTHVSIGSKFPLETTVHFPDQAKPRRLTWLRGGKGLPLCRGLMVSREIPHFPEDSLLRARATWQGHGSQSQTGLISGLSPRIPEVKGWPHQKRQSLAPCSERKNQKEEHF